MKEITRRETELLARICNENGIPLKLARDLIKTAESYSYKNVSAGERNKEYLDLIKYNFKNES
ncbi:DNA modification system-associated small protein [Mesobacillus jeotgali]|uniref:DNA modification system-associated small protein n=1 Tax=Mesobacillus jeotgali TaxID=129985 RepID=UPI001782B314|nr:DNA modification system-associated small protein [Mesobacillus jeotgali]UYZ24029.1 hypothetical protein FOF60_11035 [Mesobacillus jeotgali]